MDKSTISWSKVFSPQRIVGGVVVTIFASIVSYGYWEYIPDLIQEKINATVKKEADEMINDGKQAIANLEKFKKAFQESDRIYTKLQVDIKRNTRRASKSSGSYVSCDKPEQKPGQTFKLETFLVGCSCHDYRNKGSCAGSYVDDNQCHAVSNGNGKVDAYAYCLQAKTISIN